VDLFRWLLGDLLVVAERYPILADPASEDNAFVFRAPDGTVASFIPASTMEEPLI
jgi:hypothetical protein